MNISNGSPVINPYSNLHYNSVSERHLERSNPQLYESLVMKLAEIQKVGKTANLTSYELVSRFNELEIEMSKVASTREMALIHIIISVRKNSLKQSASSISQLPAGTSRHGE